MPGDLFWSCSQKVTRPVTLARTLPWGGRGGVPLTYVPHPPTHPRWSGVHASRAPSSRTERELGGRRGARAQVRMMTSQPGALSSERGSCSKAHLHPPPPNQGPALAPRGHLEGGRRVVILRGCVPGSHGDGEFANMETLFPGKSRVIYLQSMEGVCTPRHLLSVDQSSIYILYLCLCLSIIYTGKGGSLAPSSVLS